MPVSLYAVTKKCDELMAYTYAKLFNIPSTGLRFFTVYGPGGRPDMFYYSAAKKLISGENIKIFNHGDMKRDFTYIDDIVEGIVRVMKKAPESHSDLPPYAVYNIGGGNPENIMDYITILKEELIRVCLLPPDYILEDHLEFVGIQPGDLQVTYADSEEFERDFDFVPKTGIQEGLRDFAEWYEEYVSEKRR